MKARRAFISIISSLVVGAALAALLPASAAAGKKNFDFGFVEDQIGDKLITSSNPAERALWARNAKDAGARYLRINTYWSSIAQKQPANPANPNDPAYNWGVLDNAVNSANAEGLDVILTALNAPAWAVGPNEPLTVDRPGTWRPNAAAFGQFGQALARRYSGRVRYFEAWNEANLSNYINPQYNGRKPASPAIYRGLLNSFYDGVKSVNGSNKVITAGATPFGEKRGGDKMAPALFWREVFCLNRKLKKKCNAVAKFDIFGHNAINLPKQKPSYKGGRKDDVPPARFSELAKIVRKAEKRKTAAGPRRHALWSTESWYESKPPETKAFSLKGQAAAMQELMYLLWKQGVQNVLWLQVRDGTRNPRNPALFDFQTGVYFLDGSPKPSLKGLQFPFHAERLNKKKVQLWGIAPSKGKIKIKAKGARNQKVKGKPGKVFTTKLRAKGKIKFKAKQRKSKSLVSKVGKR